MNDRVARLARAILITAGIATALALPAFFGTPVTPSDGGASARVALAAPSADNDGNDDPTNDNSEERHLEGQVLELREDLSPPQALVGTLGENVWARLYNNQLHNSGARVGDYVKMQGEYAEHGIFDAYEVSVIDRYGSDNGNDND